VELSLYSAAQSFPIPAMRRTTRCWRPTGRYKKHKFTRVVSLPPRAAKMSLWPSLYSTLEVRYQVWRVSINHIHTSMLFWDVTSPDTHRDIRSLNQLTISTDQKNVRIGLGNRWRNVYEFLDSKNLSTSGGRVAGIGVDGLVFGGIS
jgi:hypothetical protein